MYNHVAFPISCSPLTHFVSVNLAGNKFSYCIRSCFFSGPLSCFCFGLFSFRFVSIRFFFYYIFCEICTARIYFYRDLCATIDIEVNKLKAASNQKQKQILNLTLNQKRKQHQMKETSLQIELKCSQGIFNFYFSILKFILQLQWVMEEAL